MSSGKYVAGKDFPAGCYTIKAKKGSAGNVHSSNLLENGNNEVMGQGNAFGLGIKKFENVILSKDVTLEVSGISIVLEPVGE